jgi:hypothetical protein
MFSPRALGFIAVLTIVAAVPGQALAVSLPDQDTHTVPCRPTITCTADLVQPGALEIEIGFIARRLGSGDFQYSTPLLLKLTLAEWVQLQLGTGGGIFVPTGTAPYKTFDNILIGGKFHVRDQTENGPAAALSVAASIPTYVREGTGAPDPVYNVFFIVHLGKDFAWLRADTNAGVSILGLGGSPQLQGFGSLAFSVALPRNFGVMLEGYGFTDASPVASRDAGVLGAVSFSPKPWLTVDVGVDAGLIQAVRSVSVFTGMAIVPVDLWESASERRRKAQRP